MTYTFWKEIRLTNAIIEYENENCVFTGSSIKGEYTCGEVTSAAIGVCKAASGQVIEADYTTACIENIGVTSTIKYTNIPYCVGDDCDTNSESFLDAMIFYENDKLSQSGLTCTVTLNK
eukprot:104130_1